MNTNPAAWPPRRILVPVDFSPHSASALSHLSLICTAALRASSEAGQCAMSAMRAMSGRWVWRSHSIVAVHRMKIKSTPSSPRDAPGWSVVGDAAAAAAERVGSVWRKSEPKPPGTTAMAIAEAPSSVIRSIGADAKSPAGRRLAHGRISPKAYKNGEG